MNEICRRKTTIVTEEMLPTVTHEISDRRTECRCPAYPLTKDRVIVPNYIQLFIPQTLQKKKKIEGWRREGGKERRNEERKQVEILGIEGEQG